MPAIGKKSILISITELPKCSSWISGCWVTEWETDEGGAKQGRLKEAKRFGSPPPLSVPKELLLPKAGTRLERVNSILTGEHQAQL